MLLLSSYNQIQMCVLTAENLLADSFLHPTVNSFKCTWLVAGLAKGNSIGQIKEAKLRRDWLVLKLMTFGRSTILVFSRPLSLALFISLKSQVYVFSN